MVNPELATGLVASAVISLIGIHQAYENGKKAGKDAAMRQHCMESSALMQRLEDKNKSLLAYRMECELQRAELMELRKKSTPIHELKKKV